jgi:hypothetical protein
LEVGDKLAFAGRHALAATARWRTGVDYAAIDWPYADATELLVDAQYGVLLRMEFLLDGRPFLRWTVDDVAFNEPMDDSLFVAPAGAQLRWAYTAYNLRGEGRISRLSRWLRRRN